MVVAATAVLTVLRFEHDVIMWALSACRCLKLSPQPEQRNPLDVVVLLVVVVDVLLVSLMLLLFKAVEAAAAAAAAALAAEAAAA